MGQVANERDTATKRVADSDSGGHNTRSIQAVVASWSSGVTQNRPKKVSKNPANETALPFAQLSLRYSLPENDSRLPFGSPAVSALTRSPARS